MTGSRPRMIELLLSCLKNDLPHPARSPAEIFWWNELKGNSREEIATRAPQSRRAPQIPAQRAVFVVLREMPRPLEARHKTTAATDPPHRSPIFEAALRLSPVLLPEPAVPASAIDFPSAAPRNFSKAARCSAVFCVNSTPMPFLRMHDSHQSRYAHFDSSRTHR